MAFVDKCKVLIKSGNGGNGIVSWRREAHVPLGGPAGGNGGNGGNVYFIGTKNETSLESLNYRRKIIAKNGENGGIKNMHGRNAEHVYINVPLGTIVRNALTNEIIADVLVDNKKYLIALGGKGGHGNAFFKSKFNKAPTLYELGEKGEEFEAKIELKQISDIGLIGLPNAGKSSLITCLTNARPKIANYQFTTLIPVLGVLKHNNENIVIADVPGIIAGASDGHGLGYDFLRHIERCNVLLHVVSLSDEDNICPVESINTIFNELKKYNANLTNKKIIIVANKFDKDLDKSKLNKIKKYFSEQYDILTTSCLDNTGLEQLKAKIIALYNETKPIYNDDEIIEWNELENYDNKLNRNVQVSRKDYNTFIVKCDYLEYWAYRIPINTPDNLIRLNQKISSTEMMQKIRDLGAIEGDTIILGNTKLHYED